MADTAGRPSRAVGIAVGVVLVAVWGYVRLVAFSHTVFPIAYILPLLIGIWTRDRQLLWAMAGTFAVFHSLKMFWILPADVLSDASRWATWGSTMTNILAGAAIVHLVINLRERLEGALREVRAQADELQAQGEELAQQNEELARQGEELASQNEELQAQSEEIAQLNRSLERREALLQGLLETARVSGPERAALNQIAAAACDLFPGGVSAAVVYERTASGLRVCGRAGPASPMDGSDPDALVEDAFVSLVLEEGRAAGLDDTRLRPDLELASWPGAAAPRAILCAPVRIGPEVSGAFALHAAAPREWTDEEFQLAEWLADQCGRVLQTLRVQTDLREADRRKSEFLATLSHELRNPLTAIGFALSLMEGSPGSDRRPLDVSRRQLQQLVRLVDDLLDATRLSNRKIQVRKARIDIVQVVRDVLEAVRPEVDAARHRLEVDLPPAPVWLDGDANRLAQLVTNLMSNAIRYTPPGGRIAVAVAAAGPGVALTVADSGVGMRPEDLQGVFEMFTQVGGPGSGGLGIGLALVRGIAELHGGRVAARSDGPGRGSEFRVVLPLAAESRTDGELEAASAPPSAPRCRVLVVDDNLDAVEMMAALLEVHGHEVRVAHDADSALAAARDFAPDAAVLDIGLPGVDGYELARRFRQDPRTGGVRLVALTGWGQDGDRRKAHEAGFDVHLTKPADPDRILAAIRAAETT